MALTEIPIELSSTPGIVDNSTSTAITIDASQNVGIGTSSPDSILHLSDTGESRITFEGPAWGNYIGVTAYDNVVIAADENQGSATSSIRFRVDAEERMRINSIGNVGIGVTPASDWNTGYTALQIGQGAAIMSSDDTEELFLNMNAKWASDSSWEYIADGAAAVLSMDQATPFKFRYVASGTANTDISFSEAMRIDSSGRLLINKTSSTGSLSLESQAPSGFSVGSGFYSAVTQSTIEFKDTNTTANYKVRIGSETDDLLMFAGGSERMRIDASGNVGIGRQSISQPSTGATTLAIQGTSTTKGGAIRLYSSDDSVAAYIYPDNISGLSINTSTSHPIVFRAAGTEAMRIDASGNVGIGLNNGNHRLQVLNDKANFVATKVTSTSAATTEYGISLTLTNDPNDATRYFLYCAGGVTNRAVIYSNGNIANTNNSYTGISDLKLKENIVDAGSQWDDIKALRVRKYSFKEENAAQPTQIGVIAQEVEAAGMAGLVYESPDQVTAEDGTIEDTGEVTKTVKYSILYMKAVKALQEAMDRIETLEAKVAALES